MYILISTIENQSLFIFHIKYACFVHGVVFVDVLATMIHNTLARKPLFAPPALRLTGQHNSYFGGGGVLLFLQEASH